MKTIELYLNIVHFCFYKADYKLHLLFNNINPFLLLAKIPFLKRRNERLGINIQKQLNKNFSNKNYGYSVTFAGGILLALLFFLFFGVFGLFRKLFTTAILETFHFIFFGVLSALVCYVFVFKKNIYIKYFDKFEKWTKEEKRKYSWLTFAITIIVFLLWILSF